MTEVKVGQTWRHIYEGHCVTVTHVYKDGATLRIAPDEAASVHLPRIWSVWRFRNLYAPIWHDCGTAATEPVRKQPETSRSDNPKDSIGSAKAPSMTVPTTVQALDGLAMLEGALKYGRHNYRAAPVRASVYVDALERHLKSWIEGEEIDPDSDLPHLAKARACLGIILDAQICGTLIDDRPPAKVPAGFFAECNRKAASLVAKYPNPVPPYTQAGPKQPVEVELDALKARTQPR